MTKFWLLDPGELFTSLDVIPNSSMNNAERLNALTRLLILITIGLYVLGYENYLTVLVMGLILIIVIYYNQPVENFVPTISEQQALDQGIRSFDPVYDAQPHGPENEACWFDQGVSFINAAYEVTPDLQFNHDDAAKRSYMNAKYELTPLTDTQGFKEIWRTDPSMCGGYSMVPDPHTVFPVAEPEAQGQCNYIVRSKIDHLPISQAQNGLVSARPMAEAAYNQSVMDYRTAIMNDHIDRFRRERQHNCADMKLNAFSAGSGGSA